MDTLKFVKSKYRKRVHVVSRGKSLCAQQYPAFYEVEADIHDPDICKRCKKRWELNLPSGYLRIIGKDEYMRSTHEG